MAWFIPAIMALGHGAAAAGEAVAHGAAAAGEAVGHGAEAAGQGIEHGAQAVGSKFGIGGGGEAAGSEIGKGAEAVESKTGIGGGGESAGASMPAGGAAAKPAPGFMKSTMQNAMKDQINGGFSSVLGAGMKSSPVPNEQSGAPVENPIAPSPSFPGGDSAMPQALMPGAMDIPFGAPSQRALNDTLLRNGG
jgi:hypothetical protein